MQAHFFTLISFCLFPSPGGKRDANLLFLSCFSCLGVISSCSCSDHRPEEIRGMFSKQELVKVNYDEKGHPFLVEKVLLNAKKRREN